LGDDAAGVQRGSELHRIVGAQATRPRECHRFLKHPIRETNNLKLIGHVEL
jgi:hypothetical protein